MSNRRRHRVLSKGVLLEGKVGLRTALLIGVAGLVLTCSLLQTGRSAIPYPIPYPKSAFVTGVSFDWSTHQRQASGSDNWAITWAEDGNQYGTWGDGGGFGGTGGDGRVSLGVARVEGSADSYTGYNVWGGNRAENPATVSGKSYGIIDVEGTLYLWVSPGSDTENYTEARLYTSEDGGASWRASDWAFEQSEGLILPTFLQFGPGYADARDDYVYSYATVLKDAGRLAVQKPGEIVLMRSPKSSLLDRTQYEFFAGLNAEGNPIWTGDLAKSTPVFIDSEGGVGWTTSVSYNSGLQRYFLMTEHDTTFESNLGIFDAPEPWGPWTTVLYDRLGEGEIEQTAFFYNFANKWLSEDGRKFVMVFSGIEQNDSWNTVEGRFDLAR